MHWRVCAYPRVIFIVVITEIGQALQMLRKIQFIKNKKMHLMKYNNKIINIIIPDQLIEPQPDEFYVFCNIRTQVQVK